MHFRTFYLRARKYLGQHGLKASIGRFSKAIQNLLYHNRDVVFCQDLVHKEFKEHATPEDIYIEQFASRSGAAETLLKRLAEVYPETLLIENFQERFDKKASLWCLRSGSEYIGYVWSLEGQAMKPWYLPLLENDVYLFDALIFPAFRRRGLHSVLLNSLLEHYGSRGFQRAYLETREWNIAVLNLMHKHDFIRIGVARRRLRRRKHKVTWWYRQGKASPGASLQRGDERG